jgi:hypothetical protein
VKEIRKSVEGAGTDEELLSEIIGSRSNQALKLIKEFYQQKYGESLEARVKDETSGEYRNLLISLLQCKRDESNVVNTALVNQDVTALYKAGEGKWGTDEEVFNSIFATRSSAHLAALNQAYFNNYKNSLIDVVESEFSGDIRTLLKTVLHAHINPADYFASRIYKACKGCGTNDELLIRSLIVTDETLLREVVNIYPKKYGVTLQAQIEDETSGDYRKMLVELISH